MTHVISFVCCLIALLQVTCPGVYAIPRVVRENPITRQSQRFQNLPPYKAPGKGPSIQHTETCAVSEDIKLEIESYKPNVELIVREALDGDFKGRTYRELGLFVDLFGPRVSGSQVLEDSIDYMMKQMTDNGLENVHGEEVVVPHYVRGEERAELLTPRRKTLALLGLVPSVGTPAQGIEADVLVVRSFADLTAKAENATGKIIVFNQDWQGSYGASVGYRSQGAIEAARVGGIATLIRSIADFSLDTPHTGGMSYAADVPEIPSACITVEDAEMLYRLQESGESLRISMKMLSHKMPPTTSRNAIGQLTGTEKPEELVGLTGHIDSWDVGQGAMDDAGGTQISVEALYLLKKLGLTTRRSLQAILWTSEEVGLVGVDDYVKRHADELTNISAIFESDGGAFNAIGLDFAGTEEAGCILWEILKLLEPWGLNSYEKFERVSSDITKLQDRDVPGVSLKHDNGNYFWYHHTEADVLTVLDSDELDRCLAVWAATSYVLANLNDPLPRPTPTPPTTP